MKVTRHAKNIHELHLKGSKVRVAVISDAHWDNPKCDRDRLKRDLDYCLKHKIPVLMPGDTFCIMQGRFDPRGTKSDVRPEHNTAKYLDSVIETAVEWFSPYASIIAVIGYGNHETSVLKRLETNVLERFVTLLNYKNGTNVQLGGYGGWVIVRQQYNGQGSATHKIKYFHGSGGGGVVTKGAINLTRALEMYEDYDVFVMGHIHENSSRNDVRDTIVHSPHKGYRNEQRQIHSMLTGTYKEEFGDGSKGWHVERGAPPKPTGGRIITFEVRRIMKDKVSDTHKLIDSTKFPL